MTDLSSSDGSDPLPPRNNKKDTFIWLVPPSNTDGDNVCAHTKTIIDELSFVRHTVTVTVVGNAAAHFQPSVCGISCGIRWLLLS